MANPQIERFCQLIESYESKGRHIEIGWTELFFSLAPEYASPEQIEDMRRMFFSGALFLFTELLKNRDQEFTRLIRDELCAFSDEIIFMGLPSGHA